MSLRDHATNRKHSPATLGKIATLLENSGIEPEDVGKVEKVRLSEWQGITKDAEGEAHIHELQGAGVVLAPKWADGPEWPVVQPCKPHSVRYKTLKKPEKKTVWNTAVVWPDIQIGYFRDRNDGLHPTHDEAALDIALQVTRMAKPDLVVLIGDNVDFPELSKYRRTPAFYRTTQATVDRVGLLVAEIRATVGPECVIKWIAGNHEERLPNYIIDNATAAFGLRRANSPDSWPVLSVPELCRLSECAVEYLPGYPANRVWINERLQVIHGDVVSSNNSTAHRYLNSERVSTIFGHVHRREWGERTRHTDDGPRTILAASPGCLCRIDGAVPGTKSGTDLDGIPLTRYCDWQQGLAVVDYIPGDGPFSYEAVAIHEGWARWRKQDIHGNDG